MKVLFVVPPYSCWGVQTIGTWPPLQLAYLAGEAEKAGHECRIHDAMTRNETFDDVRSEMERYKPDVVVAYDYLPVTGAISTATVPAAIQALKLAKEVDPEVVTIIGGPHPTFMYEELLRDAGGVVDFVLRGEAEATLPDLLASLTSGDTEKVEGIAFLRDGSAVATPLRAHIADLDSLEPAWHLLEWDNYHYNFDTSYSMASVLTSRGCMMGCSFCSHRQFWRGTWRARDPHKVLEEIRHLVDEYAVRFITLIDPYPTKDRERWESLLDLLIEADIGVHLLMETRVEDIIRDEDILPKYRAAGFMHLYLGAESSTDEMLESLNKGTSVDMNKRAIDLARVNGIMTEASFMIGAPSETWASVDNTIAEAIRLDPDIAVFPILTPMPYTPIYEEFKDRVRVLDYSKYNLATPIVEPYEMTLNEVQAALAKCYMSFYSQKLIKVVALPPGFQRDYLLAAYRQMMQSYAENFTMAGAAIPPQVATMLQSLR